MVEVGQFAVSEYDKNTTKKLIFEKVVSGLAANNSGVMYLLQIAAKNESLPIPAQNYTTGVWARYREPLMLLSFHKTNETTVEWEWFTNVYITSILRY